MRPIPFFERFDRLRDREAELKRVCAGYLDEFDHIAASRILRTYAFADELYREVLRNFYPALPAAGERALRTLWGTAVALDHLLDEEGLDPASLTPLRDWVANETLEAIPCAPDLIPLVYMLEEVLTNCREQGAHVTSFAAFIADLLRMLDAELASPDLTLDEPPVERVRRIARDKSVLLVWVGFQAASLGGQFDPAEARDYQEICDAVGEVLWIMDDLVDLEEDLHRGVWNRTLWGLLDDVGEVRFGELTRSKTGLAEEIINLGMVAREIEAISKRVAFLETHPRMQDAARVRTMMSFWLTAWIGIYW